MLGRGIDQALPHPSAPEIFEPHMRSAIGYVELAERASGAIARPVSFAYVWGEARATLRRERPAAFIVNLETSISTTGDPWPKGINYRMHPENLPALRAADVDCCVLANNHVLDWDRPGLLQTLAALDGAGIGHCGAGADAEAAAAPAVITHATGRIVVHGFAHGSSGVPPDWAARTGRPGVNLLPDLSVAAAHRLAEHAHATRRPGDMLVASIHWGGNWGYFVPHEQRRFARALVDGGFDLIHGHSSHHPKGIEIYRQRPILYGCGDFINDYEGIGGYETFRPNLVALYCPLHEANSGALRALRLLPFRLERFKLAAVTREEAMWLATKLGEVSRAWGTGFTVADDLSLMVRW